MSVSRVAWFLVVPFCLWLAITAIVVIVRHNISGEEVSGETVAMQSLAFSPGTLTVRPGTEVLFDNRDVAPHTVTADDGSIDSGIIQPGGAFRLTVNTSFTYFCEIHPAMTAEIRMGG